MDTREVEKAPYTFRPLNYDTRPSGLPILLALQRLKVRMYEGTVPRDIIIKRRIKNKMRKASRKRNRHVNT